MAKTKKLTVLQEECLEHLLELFGYVHTFNGHMLAGRGFDYAQLKGLHLKGHLIQLNIGTGANDSFYRVVKGLDHVR